jgi:hypothetical protein
MMPPLRRDGTSAPNRVSTPREANEGRSHRLASAAVPMALAWELDQVCDAFEAAWKCAPMADQRPRIETYLSQAAAAARSVLLRELVLLGDCPRISPRGLIGPS